MIARGVTVGEVSVDVSYGGAIYASLPARALGLEVVPEHYGELVARRARDQVGARRDRGGAPSDRRPALGGLRDDPLRRAARWPGRAAPAQRPIFADGEADRSPCGSGTSARVALLAADGRMPPGAVLTHDSIVGTTFTARIVSADADGVVTEVEGMAYRTGEHRFVLDPRDPFGTGFVLR